MADSLVLKGVKDVSRQSGTELLRLNPKRGGDTHQIKRWWTPNTVSTVYVACTVFKVTQGDLVTHLAVQTEETTHIRIDVADGFLFNFYDNTGVDRAALLDENMVVIEHYAFPRISGGKIMTVTPPGAPERPEAAPPPPPDTTIDSVSVAGEAAPTAGDTETYTVTVTGDATPFTYLWGVSAGGTIDSGQGSTSAVITWNTDGANAVTCAVSSSNANFDGNDDSDTFNVNVAKTFADRVADADVSVAVTVADTGSGDKYQIDGVEQDTITAAPNETIHFDLSDASLSGHPLKIYADSTKALEITVGIEQEGTDLLFTPPIAGSFSYQCANHADMGGDITIA